MDVRVKSRGRRLFVFAFLLSLSMVVAAGVRSDDRYQGEGRVLGIDEEKRMVFVAHGPIPGFMPAPMRHGFEVHRVELLKGLQKGDVIRFVLEVRNDVFGISSIEQIRDPQ